MTLYYSLVFALLVLEMVIFMALIVPMPFAMKRRLFTFISESPIIAKFQYGMKITFIFILILFIDSVNRVYRVQMELSSAKHSGQSAAQMGSERMEVQARKFYSQRNMYLCGFTLFLSLILNRTYVMILETLRLEAELKKAKGDDKAAEKAVKGIEQAGEAGEIGRLKKELERKDKEIQAIKSQSKGLQAEYDRLGDQVSKSDDMPKKDK